MDTSIGFSTIMFVYAIEDSPGEKVKVSIPEIFFQNFDTKQKEYKLAKGSTSMFINDIPPAISEYITMRNYMTINTTLTNIKRGERLIAQFVDSNPKYGIILARCNNE